MTHTTPTPNPDAYRAAFAAVDAARVPYGVAMAHGNGSNDGDVQRALLTHDAALHSGYADALYSVDAAWTAARAGNGRDAQRWAWQAADACDAVATALDAVARASRAATDADAVALHTAARAASRLWRAASDAAHNAPGL